MLQSLLVANRGEIAVRIMRSAQELGIRTVGIYEETDKAALHIMKADEAKCIGSGPRKDYLSIDQNIQAAKASGAEAIHPGYGFLAENPDFPKQCADAGLLFVGPSSEVIVEMGSKVLSRRRMIEAGVPVIPGSDIIPEGAEGEQQAVGFAEKHGFPVMIKAVAGGGGKGIRMVTDRNELLQGLQAARSEAKTSFGNPAVYLEKAIQNPRHVEVQILADRQGNAIHLGTRNCSIQRRHQKLIEIAPSGLPADLAGEICEHAVKAARSIGYESAGTVEFLLDEKDSFYFLEINTRIQVEHTVTEMITGIDIVREQLRIASGEPLSFSQEDVQFRGQAIELRINAEDPKNNFMGCPGTIQIYQSPGGHGVRLDGAVYQGYEITPYYDSMLVKLTVYGFTWTEAVERLRRALQGFHIVGVKTTIPFYKQILEEPDFIRQQFDTSYLDTHPRVFDYREEVPEIERLARLVAEINAYGFNPYTH